MEEYQPLLVRNSYAAENRISCSAGMGPGMVTKPASCSSLAAAAGNVRPVRRVEPVIHLNPSASFRPVAQDSED